MFAITQSLQQLFKSIPALFKRVKIAIHSCSASVNFEATVADSRFSHIFFACTLYVLSHHACHIVLSPAFCGPNKLSSYHLDNLRFFFGSLLMSPAAPFCSLSLCVVLSSFKSCKFRSQFLNSVMFVEGLKFCSMKKLSKNNGVC